MNSAHQTVLLQEACQALVQNPHGRYVDATFGRGGHSRLILSMLSSDAELLAFDKDPEAVALGQELAKEDSRFSVVSGSFTGLAELAEQRGLQGQLAGILLDLGVSSPQLDQAERGFSFQHDGPLDMRMNPNAGQSAAQWLAIVKESELADVLKTYGEERFARRIAAAIVEARAKQPLTRTVQLAEIIKAAHPRWEKDKHPATRSFQAIRIHLNHELEELEQMLELAVELLAVGGRLVVISFHSLEDRITKRFMRSAGRSGAETLPRHIPLRDSEIDQPRLRLIGKAVKCSETELRENRRARSAVMRVAEKAA